MGLLRGGVGLLLRPNLEPKQCGCGANAPIRTQETL